ncbi:MAG: hypothetical protein P8R46_08170 [Planctomycetota bacterium]|nr:hypothetical protein [Planctomycetota bacterium]
MPSLFKPLLKPLAALAICAAVGAAVAYFAVPSAAKTAVERGSEFAFGVPASLGSLEASLGLAETTLGFSELEVESPPGFEEPILTFGRFRVGVGTSSLVAPVKDLGTLLIEDVSLTLLQDGLRSNLAPILKQVRSLSDRTGKDGSGPPADVEVVPGAEPGPRLKVGKVRIVGIRARLKVDGIPGIQAVDEVVELPPIERDWSAASGEDGLTVAELGGQLLDELQVTALEQLRGEVPDEVVDAVQKGLVIGLDELIDGTAGDLKGLLNEEASGLLKSGASLFENR